MVTQDLSVIVVVRIVTITEILNGDNMGCLTWFLPISKNRNLEVIDYLFW